MTKRDFRFFVRIGHGKAIVEVQKNGDGGFDEIILAACRKETLYDTWFEEDKGWYLAQLLVATGRPKHYLSLLISEDHLIKGEANVRQWASILGNLGRLGFEEASAYIDERWQADLRRTNMRWVNAYINVRGPSGYREVLDWVEANWKNRRKPVEDFGTVHWEANYRLGKVTAAKIRDAFSKRAPWLPRIADFPEIYKDQTVTLQKQLSATERILGNQLVNGRLLKDDELETVRQLLKQDLSPQQLRLALRVFSTVPYPGDPSELVAFLDREEENIIYSVLECFGKLRYPPIRGYAFTLCSYDYLRSACIEVLCANYEKGDETWVYDLLVKNTKGDYLHSDIISAREVIEANRRGNWNGCLQFLYRITPCQLCRGGLAKLLHQQSRLSANQITELRFDAYVATRQWANRLKLPTAK